MSQEQVNIVASVSVTRTGEQVLYVLLELVQLHDPTQLQMDTINFLLTHSNHPCILTTLCSQIYTRQRYCGSLIKHTYVQVIRWNLYTLPSVEQ